MEDEWRTCTPRVSGGGLACSVEILKAELKIKIISSQDGTRSGPLGHEISVTIAEFAYNHPFEGSQGGGCPPVNFT